MPCGRSRVVAARGGARAAPRLCRGPRPTPGLASGAGARRSSRRSRGGRARRADFERRLGPGPLRGCARKSPRRRGRRPQALRRCGALVACCRCGASRSMRPWAPRGRRPAAGAGWPTGARSPGARGRPRRFEHVVLVDPRRPRRRARGPGARDPGGPLGGLPASGLGPGRGRAGGTGLDREWQLRPASSRSGARSRGRGRGPGERLAELLAGRRRAPAHAGGGRPLRAGPASSVSANGAPLTPLPPAGLILGEDGAGAIGGLRGPAAPGTRRPGDSSKASTA